MHSHVTGEKSVNIGSDKVLSSVRSHAITWTNADLAAIVFYGGHDSGGNKMNEVC